MMHNFNWLVTFYTNCYKLVELKGLEVHFSKELERNREKAMEYRKAAFSSPSLKSRWLRLVNSREKDAADAAIRLKAIRLAIKAKQ